MLRQLREALAKGFRYAAVLETGLNSAGAEECHDDVVSKGTPAGHFQRIPGNLTQSKHRLFSPDPLAGVGYVFPWFSFDLS